MDTSTLDPAQTNTRRLVKAPSDAGIAAQNIEMAIVNHRPTCFL